MRCRTARIAILAARDGELGARRQLALDRHLARCAACRAEQAPIEGVLAALDGLDREAAVPARLEQEVLRRVRVLGAEATSETAAQRVARWLGGLVPAFAAAAVVIIAVVGIRGRQQGDTGPASPAVARNATPAAPERTAVARRAKDPVPDEPPAELASRPDLFVDLPILRDMDKLRHFDSIATMEDDDPTVPDTGPSPSNG